MSKKEKTKIAEHVKAVLEPMTAGFAAEEALQASLLIDNIAFQASELAELRDDIQKNGAVKLMKNGNNITSLAANPSVKVYNSLMKTLIDTLKQLRRIAPATAAAGSALLAFIAEGRPEDQGDA